MAGHYTSHAAGFPHSDTLGSPPVHQLPEAYRRSPRPSSAPDTKASTMRSYTLTTLYKRAANQITHNNKQSRRSFIRCSRPLFTNKNNNKKNTQQSVPPQPNNVPTRMPHTPSKEHTTHAHNTQQVHRESFCDVPPKNKHHTNTCGLPTQTEWLLLRKEVIQPHLPVRLPCYDLVPITSPTFDGSPHKG